ncbi:plasmid replication initiator RepA, partial [Acetobacter farinalis]|nr:plasmid replication initiator RepA [Acetobacter farinalis]
MKPRIKATRQRNPELALTVSETPNVDGRSVLLPERYPTPDLFICD